MTFHVPERYRFYQPGHPMSSTPSFGCNGAFVVTLCGRRLNAIASDGEGWEHVSINGGDRTPTWEQMCAAKALFWDDEDCVVQFHPPASEYVNCHPHVLHLWRKVGSEFDRPPSWMVGPKA